MSKLHEFNRTQIIELSIELEYTLKQRNHFICFLLNGDKLTSHEYVLLQKTQNRLVEIKEKLNSLYSKKEIINKNVKFSEEIEEG